MIGVQMLQWNAKSLIQIEMDSVKLVVNSDGIP